MSSFAELLTQLSGVLEAPLAPDEHGTCAIDLETGPQIRLEPVEDKLLIGMTLGTVSPGLGRGNFFKAMLIANGRPYPRFGNFAYAKTVDQVLLSEMIPMNLLDGETLAMWVLALAEQGAIWEQAIKRGQIPSSPKG